MNFDFERRIAMFPAGFDQDGLMFANTRFGDFPHRMPSSKWQQPEELFTGWMLLSYRKPVKARSVRYPYAAANLTDENPRTFWMAETNQPGVNLIMDLAKTCEVRAVQVNFADFQSGLFDNGPEIYTQFVLHHSMDGENWTILADLRQEKRDRPNAYFELKEPVSTRFIRYTHEHVASPNLAISDIRVFGSATDDPPGTPARLQVRRDSDGRNALITWEHVPGALGYNIRWGIGPEKLYQTYQVFADQRPRLELRALTLGQSYSFAIEAFNETGVSKLSGVVNIE